MQNDPSGDVDSHGGVSGSKRKVDIVSCAPLERVPLIQLKLSRAGVWPVTPTTLPSFLGVRRRCCKGPGGAGG